MTFGKMDWELMICKSRPLGSTDDVADLNIDCSVVFWNSKPILLLLLRSLFVSSQHAFKDYVLWIEPNT